MKGKQKISRKAVHKLPLDFLHKILYNRIENPVLCRDSTIHAQKNADRPQTGQSVKRIIQNHEFKIPERRFYETQPHTPTAPFQAPRTRFALGGTHAHSAGSMRFCRPTPCGHICGARTVHRGFHAFGFGRLRPFVGGGAWIGLLGEAVTGEVYTS
jgi:hypothetical protein